MPLPIIQEFACSLPADSCLLRADVIAGGAPDQAEVLSLAAAAQSLFISACLESRSIASVDKRHELWGEVATLFDELCASWTDVKTEEEQIQWLLSRITHYSILAHDRCDLYCVSAADRRHHAQNRDAGFETTYQQRHNLEPGGEKQPGSLPAHVYQLGTF